MIWLADDGSHPACGGKTEMLSGVNGTFESPGFGETDTYKANADCAWHIETSPGKVIFLPQFNYI